MKRLTPLVAGLVAALMAVLSVATPGLADTPARQIALGISEPNWYDVDPSPTHNDAVDSITAELGRQPAIWSLWSDWGSTGPDGNGPFANIQYAIDGLSARGIVPQIYWEPVDPHNQNDCTHWQLSTINKGLHDDYIRAWAQAAAADGNTIILRFAHEMNGYWYIWGNNRCTNTAKKFRNAWKHVWTIFQEAGATNVKFEFSVLNARYVTSDYPGDEYVDYLGLTALTWGIPGHSKWRTLVKAMKPTMAALLSISTTKPIIAGEIGAAYAPKCGSCDKAAWLANGYPAVYNRWPQIVAMVYLDYDLTSVDQADWRLTRPQSALNAYKNIVANPDFQGTFQPVL